MDYTLYATRVFVTDWERALRFYTETLEMPVGFRSDDIGWAEFDTGEAKLALERVDFEDAEAMALVGRFVGVSLRVADLDATHATLATRGVDFLAPPEQQTWGGVLAHLRDPDRNVLTLLG
jgi:catechol 2,3-dioxygenase-like lactoylglutathione lyase family enzyme